MTTPDGKTALLRPKVIDQWDKNAPLPVEITAKEPYTLPNWVEGDNRKSLKSLGLDTTTPGTYTITGLYEETGLPRDGGWAAHFTPRCREPSAALWPGPSRECDPIRKRCWQLHPYNAAWSPGWLVSRCGDKRHPTPCSKVSS